MLSSLPHETLGQCSHLPTCSSRGNQGTIIKAFWAPTCYEHRESPGSWDLHPRTGISISKLQIRQFEGAEVLTVNVLCPVPSYEVSFPLEWGHRGQMEKTFHSLLCLARILARYLVTLNLSILICKMEPIVSTLYRGIVRIP